MIILQVSFQFLIILGLNSCDITKISKFLHFRPVQHKNKKDLIEMGEAIFNFNFLDSLDQDPIKGNN